MPHMRLRPATFSGGQNLQQSTLHHQGRLHHLSGELNVILKVPGTAPCHCIRRSTPQTKHTTLSRLPALS
ncbi:hypothetical protein M3J09_006582 [Ascochyta lentis]